jgi:hypothetical protein
LGQVLHGRVPASFRILRQISSNTNFYIVPRALTAMLHARYCWPLVISD